MPRITSLNILLEAEGKDYLSELYSAVIQNVMKSLVSVGLKNENLSGDPTSGSVEAKRFANATPKPYGTARAAGKGDAVKARPVTVVIDQDQEIIEEIEEKDIRLYGVDGLLDRRARNHVLRMAAELDTAFFAAAYADSTDVVINESDPIEDQLEDIIQACENTKNNFVDGVPRAMMHLVCSTKVYGAIRKELDKRSNPNVDTTAEEFYTWHGVEVKSCVHLPAGCRFLLMVTGSVAQPVMTNQYTAEKVNLSEAYAVELFYHYGTKVVTPDLIFKPVAANAKLSALTIGSLTLSPPFDADTTAYTASTTNATNTVTATAADSGATIAIKNGETTVTNGGSATWSDGNNTLTATVTNGTATKTYTVTVTKS